MWCLEGEECVAPKFKDRDESRWVLQKWEEEVEVGKILHPTQSHAETTPSSPVCFVPPPPQTRMAIAASPRLRPQMPLLPVRLQPWMNWTTIPMLRRRLSPHPHALILPSRHRLEMRSWPQCAMPYLMAQATLRPNCNMCSHCSVTNGNDHLT